MFLLRLIPLRRNRVEISKLNRVIRVNLEEMFLFPLVPVMNAKVGVFQFIQEVVARAKVVSYPYNHLQILHFLEIFYFIQEMRILPQEMSEFRLVIRFMAHLVTYNYHLELVVNI
jgi:hypothetical protein